MRAGLEVHQQLATGKLFCDCPSELTESTRGTFSRALTTPTGETGVADRAARVQGARGLRFRYEVS